MPDFVNKSFETAEVDSGVDITTVPASWDPTGVVGTWASATFGPPLFYSESFEALWGDNQDALDAFAVTDLDVADFGVAPQTVYEGYETQWGGNEAALDDLDDPGYRDPAAFDAAGDAVEDFDEEWVSRHAVADKSHFISETLPIGDDPATRALANEIKTKYNLHIADATVHSVVDAVNTITSPDATDLASTVALCIEIWNDIWLHIASNTYHSADVSPQLKPTNPAGATIPPVTYGDCVMVLWYSWIHLNMHFVWRSNSDVWYYDFFIDSFGGGTYYQLLFPSYDASAAPEDFESQWAMPLGNENSLTELTPGDIDQGVFETTAGTTTEETFEEEIDLDIVLAQGEGDPRNIDKTHGCKIEFGGTLVASALVVQERRKHTGTWLDKDTVTSVPVTVLLDEEFKSVRINTMLWGSGVPTATLWFRDMETM